MHEEERYQSSVSQSIERTILDRYGTGVRLWFRQGRPVLREIPNPSGTRPAEENRLSRIATAADDVWKYQFRIRRADEVSTEGVVAIRKSPRSL